MTPAEITSRYPIGFAIELSARAREQVRLFAMIRESAGFVSRELNDKVKGFSEDQMKDSDLLKNVIDEVFHEHPQKAAFCEAMSEGNSPLFRIIGDTRTTPPDVVKRLQHAIVFADLVEHHGMTKRVYSKLLLFLSEASGNVVVRGHDFTPSDLGLNDKVERCPDVAPPGFGTED
jgi:hypothetical protein